MGLLVEEDRVEVETTGPNASDISKGNDCTNIDYFLRSVKYVKLSTLVL